MVPESIGPGIPVDDIVHLAVQAKFIFLDPLKMGRRIFQPLLGDLDEFKIGHRYAMLKRFLEFVTELSPAEFKKQQMSRKWEQQNEE